MRDYEKFMGRVILALALVSSLAGVLFGQVTVQVKDKSGAILSSTVVPDGGEIVLKIGSPNSTNPTPVPATAAHLILVRDDATGRMTADQRSALADPELRAAVKAKGMAWWVYDVSQDEVKKTPADSPPGLGLLRVMQNQSPPAQAPCVIWLDPKGKVLKVAGLPADKSGINQLLGK